MAEIKCLKNSTTKKYIVPTNEWLVPLEPLITSISTKGKLILANMITKEKVVVKITQNINKLLKNKDRFIQQTSTDLDEIILDEIILDENKNIYQMVDNVFRKRYLTYLDTYEYDGITMFINGQK